MGRTPRGLALAVAFAVAVAGVAWSASRPAAAQDATPPAGDGAEPVAYVDADEQEQALFEVTEVADPADDLPGADELEAGERAVLVALSVENTGDDPLPLDPATILLRDDDGFLYGVDADLQDALDAAAATPGADPAPEEAAFEAGDLEPGEERAGALAFAVDEDADLSDVLFVPETGRLIVLADLGGEGGFGADRDDDEDAAQDEDEDATETPRATSTPRATADVDDDTDVDEAADDEDPTPTPAPAPTEAPATDADTDGDGLTDAEEAAAGTDPTTTDTDGDGLNDGDELATGADPFTVDTDGDGVSDADEVLTAGTDATSADTDGDGLGDADEAAAGTDPFVPDSDGDGLTDGQEVVRGGDPLDGGGEAEETVEATAEETPEATAEETPEATEAAPATTETPTTGGTDAGVDSDLDGLTDAEESALGTDAGVADSDGDGLPDGDEQNLFGTSPLSGDSDNDGVADLTEVIQPTPTPTS
jgi:hypothetical protein